MSVKVAINGFGRIGRLAFRQMFNAEGYEIVAINDLTSPAMLAHLLKYDTAQGRYALGDTVTADENSITVDGKKIRIYAEKDANTCPWGELGVDVVPAQRSPYGPFARRLPFRPEHREGVLRGSRGG